MIGTENNTQERGQVGIGTLIVFIALVLVAAIAAGVLINTAGFLQSQAEATGEESTDQVANGLQVVSATADTNADAEITDSNVDLTLQLAPGSDPVDLEEINVDTFGDQTIEEVTGTSDETLESSEEFVTITLNFESGADGTPAAGDEVEVVITTADGSQTTEVLLVPDPLDPNETVRL